MDFDEQPTTTFVTEFLAVVLAGFGNNLAPLTGDDGEEPCPKALLPIANKPMIDYPLAWLEQSGIKDVLLICPIAHRSAISNYIDNDSTSSYASLRIELQGLDETIDTDDGTSAVLRHFSSRIKSDFIVLPCDFLPPSSLPLSRILNKYRVDVGAQEAIATACWFETINEKPSFEEHDGSSKTSPIVWDATSSTLLHISSAKERESTRDELDLRLGLLSRYPCVQMSARLQDSHVYVCKRSILDVLEQKAWLESFRNDFFPWLCKLQYQSTRLDKYGRVLVPIIDTKSQGAALSHSTMHANIKTRSNGVLSGSRLSSEEDQEILVSHKSLRVGLILHRLSEGYASRVNTLNTFLDANRRVLSSPGYTYTPPSEPDRRSLVDPKSQVSADSMIGESTKVGERTIIKKSVIGKHCNIGKMVKIVGCVILDHCVIEDGAKLESCLIGQNTKIGAKADLSRCATQAGYEVDAAEILKNEKLEASNWAAADQNDEDSDVSSSDTASSAEE